MVPVAATPVESVKLFVTAAAPGAPGAADQPFATQVLPWALMSASSMPASAAGAAWDQQEEWWLVR